MNTVSITSIFTAGRRAVDFETSPEAAICFNCQQKKCSGSCERFKKEYEKLKKDGVINDPRSKKKIQKED